MKILKKDFIADNLVRLTISSPDIAKNAKAGQFILLMVREEGERMPLTIADLDKNKQTITIIAQIAGHTTKMLSELNVGDSLYSLVGPLGNATHVENYSLNNASAKVVVVGGGVGIAELLPVAKAFKAAGNYVVSVLGGRTKDLVILQDEVAECSDEVLVATNDGSQGTRGFVTDVLKDLLSDDIALVFCVGPVPMMKAVSELTRPSSINTIVCLNAIMVDGTGMCGSCRLHYDGKIKFCCVDGPDFDGHLVDFDELMVRQKRFTQQEERSNEKDHSCRLETQADNL